MAQEVIEVVEREVEVIEILERGLVGPTGPVGPQANINYTVVSSSQTVTNRQMIAANTLAGSFTLTLPSNPAAGDAIDIFDYSDTFDTNPLTIARNGQNIEGLADNLVANVEGAYFTLIFTGGTRGWQVVPRYGVSGLQNVLTTEGDLLYRGASAETRLGIGTAGQILKVNSGATAPEWGNEVMSAADKTKLDGIAAGAEVNVNADWNAVSGDAQILNKPATFTPSSHTHGNITNDGKIGSTSGLPVVTTTAGAVTTLALGTANQVLRVNSGATGVEFGAGFDAASPPAIGSTTPNSGAFTTLSATGQASFSDQITGANATATPPTTTTAAKGLQFALLGGSVGNTAAIYGSHGGTSTLGIGIANSSAGSITQVAAFTSTGLSVNGGTVTASAPVLDLAQTWNNAAATFTGLRFNVTNTASAAASLLADFQVGGTTQFAIRRNGSINVPNGFSINVQGAASSVEFDGTGSPNPSVIAPSFISNGDLFLTGGRLGTGNVIIRTAGASSAVDVRGTTLTTPQTFRIYNTTDAGLTNFERGFMRWSSNVLQIGTEKAGTGSARALEFQTDGTTRMTIAANGNITIGNFASITLGTNGFVNAPAGVLGMTAALWNNQLRVSGSGVVAWYTAQWNAVSTDLEIARDAADTLAQRRAGNAQTFRIYNTFTSATNFERLNIRWASNELIIDAEAGSAGGTLRGIKLGSATSSLLGFYGATPVDRPATVADPAGGGTIDTEARTAIGEVIDRLQELGLIAT